MIRTIVLACFVLIGLCPGTASAQFDIFWNVDDGDWNDSDNWFEGFGPPDADFGDTGVVANGGLAFLDSAANRSPGGVVLGDLGNTEGTLHIRSGGELTVISEENLNGRVTVGEAGLGTLFVDRGGSLTAESLRSGGNDASSLVLGAGNSGNAVVKINGAAALGRHTRIIGPNVAFEAESLNLSGILTSEISGANHSTLDIGGTATLGGTLDLQFAAPFQPAVGQTWDLIDAATINGNFADITSSVSPGPGLAFSLSKVAGGDNGTLAQVGIDARLQLTVDRRTGASHIQNFAEGTSITINGYGVGSAGGILNKDNWKPMDAGGPWAGNSSNTHVSEISLQGSREIVPGADIDLGNVYAFQPTTLGESNEDVFFEYHVDGGDVVNGLVNFTGAHNDVVLVVAEDGAFIQNQSTTPLTINGYAIVSEAGSLDPTNWTSLTDGNGDWTEANAANNHITELNLGGTLTIPATSDAIPLGPIIADGASDLLFVVNLAESGPHMATVEYRDGVIEFGGVLLGDCNADQALTADDLACLSTIPERDAVLAALNTLPGDLQGNGDVAFADFLILSGNFGESGNYTDGNIDLAGDIGFPDFLVLSENFGQTLGRAVAVPEPTGLAWLLWPLLLLSRRRNR